MTQVCYGVDAGGSRTRVRVDDGTAGGARFTLGSVNPAAVGEDRAAGTLHDLFRRLCGLAAGRSARGWLASAAVDERTAAAEVERTREAAAAAGLAGPVVLSNDVVPLLLAPPRNGYGIVVVAGTGSGFLAGDGGRWARAGGYEYLASDEGSAFDIGLAGLRAAARSLDGRGPATLVLEGLEGAGGRPLPEFARGLAAEPRPKRAVAALAPVVCAAWARGDEVAGQLVAGAIDALVSGAAAAGSRLGLGAGTPAVLTGGVVTGCPEFAGALGRALEERLGLRVEPVVRDGSAAALRLAQVLEEEGDAPVGRALADGLAWSAALPGAAVTAVEGTA